MRARSGSCSCSRTLQGVRKAINPSSPRAGKYQRSWARIWRAQLWRIRVGTERYRWLRAGSRDIALSARIWRIWRRSNRWGRIATTASQNRLQRCRRRSRLRWETVHIRLAARMLTLWLERCQALLHLQRHQLAISKTPFSGICKELLNHLVTSSDNAKTKSSSVDQTKFQEQSRRSPCWAHCHPLEVCSQIHSSTPNHPCDTSQPKSFLW